MMNGCAIKLIVGLGNTHKKYALTRHNAGFWFINAICAQYSVNLKYNAKLSAYCSSVLIGASQIYLACPATSMNLSGFSLQKLMHFYKLSVEQILVAHDELDLSPGHIKLKKNGGHGGHNGLRNIYSHIDSNFYRLRIGIGHPGHRHQVIGYVLKNPDKIDQKAIEKAIDKGIETLPALINAQWHKAMNYLHAYS